MTTVPSASTCQPGTSHYREWSVPGAGGVIACRWQQTIDRRAPGGHVQRVLPDGCADIVVMSAGPALVVGPTAQVALPELAPGTTLTGLRLRPEAIRAAFGIPGAELRDATLPLDEVIGPSQSDRLATLLAENDETAIAAWAANIEVDRRTAAAIRRLSGAEPVDVAAVATALGLSSRQLRRVLLSDVGLGPKTLQRIARLQRFLRLADRSGDARGCRDTTPLAIWAALAGYADQSHLTREVVELAATTPARLLAERGDHS